MDLKDRRILDDGTVLCQPLALLEMLYAGKSIEGAICEPSEDVDLHDAADRLLDTDYGSIPQADGPLYEGIDWFEHWLTPEPYASMDVEAMCLDRAATEVERERVMVEMEMFRQRNMIPVLRHLIFLVDHWRSRNVLWGVGRGSSVSSLVLFLIGINRINPLDFDLDITEFLK